MSILRPIDLTDGPYLHWGSRGGDPSSDRPEDIVKCWLKRIRYKPDTRLEVVPWGNYRDEVHVSIRRLLADSTLGITTLVRYVDPDALVEVDCTVPVPPYVIHHNDFDGFVRWLRSELLRMEAHELDEWLRVDDKLPFNPHAKEASS